MALKILEIGTDFNLFDKLMSFIQIKYTMYVPLFVFLEVFVHRNKYWLTLVLKKEIHLPVYSELQDEYGA